MTSLEQFRGYVVMKGKSIATRMIFYYLRKEMISSLISGTFGEIKGYACDAGFSLSDVEDCPLITEVVEDQFLSKNAYVGLTYCVNPERFSISDYSKVDTQTAQAQADMILLYREGVVDSATNAMFIDFVLKTYCTTRVDRLIYIPMANSKQGLVISTFEAFVGTIFGSTEKHSQSSSVETAGSTTPNNVSLPNSPQMNLTRGGGRKRKKTALVDCSLSPAVASDSSECRVSLSGDVSAGCSGRSRKKTSTPQVSPLIPSKKHGTIVARKIEEEIELFRSASRNLAPPYVERIAIEKLHQWTAMREVDQDHVDKIYHLCVTNLWNKTKTSFVVSQMEQDQFFVLDGNHRLAAFVRINNELLVDKKPAFMKQIVCRVYGKLSIQQQLGVLKSVEQTEIHLPFFLVDKVRVVRRYLENRQIKYPMDQVEKQTGLLREILPGAQPYVAKLASMPTEHWNSVADVLKLFNKGKEVTKKVGVPEDYSKAYKVDNHLDLHSGQFWINFNGAYRKNSTKALQVLSSLAEKDVKSVELELKDVCPDLVSFLQKNGDLFFLSAEELSVELLGRLFLRSDFTMLARHAATSQSFSTEPLRR
uniref:DUF1015 family protein n=1 Tax=Ditylenchus dipsaci TaxID=166011 RepID=A0A915DTR5_9BILA